MLRTGTQLHPHTEAQVLAGKLPSVAVPQSPEHRSAVSVLLCDTLIYSPGIMTQGSVAKENVKNSEGQRLLGRARIL